MRPRPALPASPPCASPSRAARRRVAAARTVLSRPRARPPRAARPTTGAAMTLEQRVHALEARLDILQLEAVYARTWDTADAPRWAGVFTADGAFVLIGKE